MGPLDYTTIDALSEAAYETLVSLVEGDMEEGWRKRGIDDMFWVVTVLLGEREGCGFAYTIDVDEERGPCPVELVLDDSPLSFMRTTRRLSETGGESPFFQIDESGSLEERHYHISRDPGMVETLNSLEEKYTKEWSRSVGRAFGYPADAIAAYVDDDVDAQDMYAVVDGMEDVSAADARFMSVTPYTPAPTEAAVRTAIERGKYYVSLKEQLAEDRSEFSMFPEGVLRVPSVEGWEERVIRHR